jgi:hypothetical protein
MESGIALMKQYPPCQFFWTSFANCIMKLQQNFPADGILVALKLLVEVELRYFHCIEEHFDLGW